MASFAQLTVIVLAGLAGPLLSASKKIMIPVVVGELSPASRSARPARADQAR